MYREFFGIEENPFSNTPDPKYVYLSKRHSEALAHLVFGVQGGNGFVLLTGEVGTGKTTLCRYMSEQMSDDVKLALCLNPRISEIDLLATICEELGVDIAGLQPSIKTLTAALNIFLLDFYATGGRAVVIIDEAQNLSFELLEQVRLLTNLETSRNKLLQIILIGQTELRDHIDQFSLRQLSQRISARYHLEPMDQQETENYILHRTEIAGLPDDLFTEEVLHEIYASTRGIPRLINSVCERCLLGAYASGQAVITKQLAAAAAIETLGETRQSTGQSTQQSVTLPSEPDLFTPKPHSKFLIVFLLLGVLAAAFFVSPPLQNLIKSNLSYLLYSQSSPTRTSSSSPQDVLNKLSEDDTYTNAFTNLGGQWNSTKGIHQVIQSCQDALQAGLACLPFEGKLIGNWPSLYLINRPFMIELVTKDGDSRYLTVVKVSDASVTLATATKPIVVSREDFKSLPTGSLLLLWQPPPFYNRILQPNMIGKDVSWVRKRMLKINTQLLEAVDDPEVYDENLRARINQFKHDHALKSDGLIDPLTLIHLDNEIGDIITPVLYPNL